MFRAARQAHDEHTATSTVVAGQLQLLPVWHVTFQLEGAWLVVGPTGLFVITADDGDLRAAADRATARALEVRNRLATELAWVPFVDALVGTSRDEALAELPCLAVPIDLLLYTIAEGPRTGDDDTLERLTRMRLQLHTP